MRTGAGMLPLRIVQRLIAALNVRPPHTFGARFERRRLGEARETQGQAARERLGIIENPQQSLAPTGDRHCVMETRRGLGLADDAGTPGAGSDLQDGE